MPPDRSALVLSPEAPYPLAGGGSIRTASILEYLGPRYALDVIVFREPGAPDPRCAFRPGLARGVHVIDLPRHSKAPAARAARNLTRLTFGRPPLNDRFQGFAREVARCLEGQRYDVALIEHFWCAPYVEQVARHASRVILDLHNVELATLEVCSQAIDAAGDVPELKAHRRQPVRPSPNLLVRETGGPMRQILARLPIRVQRGRQQRMNALDRPAQPGFRN